MNVSLKCVKLVKRIIINNWVINNTNLSGMYLSHHYGVLDHHGVLVQPKSGEIVGEIGESPD